MGCTQGGCKAARVGAGRTAGVRLAVVPALVRRPPPHPPHPACRRGGEPRVGAEAAAAAALGGNTLGGMLTASRNKRPHLANDGGHQHGDEQVDQQGHHVDGQVKVCSRDRASDVRVTTRIWWSIS